MRTFTRWIIATAAALVLAHAAAVEPVDGTEVVITDAGGHQLVAYGVVNNGTLVLRMGDSPESFVLLLIAPDGSLQRFDGVKGAGGAMLVDLPDGSREALKNYLGRSNIGVHVVRTRGGDSRAGGGSHEGSGDTASGGTTDSGSDGSSDSSGSSSGSESGGSDPSTDPGGTDSGDGSDTSSTTTSDTSVSVDLGDSTSIDTTTSTTSGTDGN